MPEYPNGTVAFLFTDIEGSTALWERDRRDDPPLYPARALAGCATLVGSASPGNALIAWPAPPINVTHAMDKRAPNRAVGTRSGSPRVRLFVREASPLSSVPRPLTALVGREAAAAAVSALLRRSEVQLLTLIGPGGVGKTRLAIEVATRWTEDVADEVAFVALAPLSDPKLVVPAIAQAVGVREAGEQPLLERLITSLRSRALLLVLDNCEQVLDAALQIGELLVACPRLTVLATSRAPLRLSGEREFPVPPLSLPPAEDGTTAGRQDGQLLSQDIEQAEAVRLFAERAQTVLPTFALTADNAETVGEICRRLDGLPLAIELAAARVKLFPPATLLARLERRLPVLIGGPRDAPPRLRTMRDAIAWSYELLPSDARALFRRLAVFAGGFTLEAAEAIGASQRANSDVTPGLAVLLDASIVSRADALGGETDLDARYSMLETIREYGLEQLAEHDIEEGEARDALVSWCIALADRAATELHGPKQRAWCECLEAELPNLRAALTWIDQRDNAEAGLRLTGALTDFLWLRGHLREGREWLERALARSGDVSSGSRNQALFGAGFMAWFQGDYDAAATRFAAAQDQAKATADASIAARALYMLANIAFMQGELELASARGEEAVAQLRELGETVWLAYALNDVGTILAAAGDGERSRALSEEGLALTRAIGNRPAAAIKLSDLGFAAHGAGNDELAASYFQESLALFAELGDAWYLAYPVTGLACVLAGTGEPERAARLFGSAAVMYQRSGATVFPSVQERIRLAQERVRTALGENQFAAAYGAGAALRLEAIVAEAGAASAPDSETAPTPQESSHAAASFGLTSRELEVLRLLAEGRSDKEIGARLFISHRTAMNHVARILDKLDVASRALAVHEATRRGLL